MAQQLHTIKTDLQNVFIHGDAADIQMIRVFVMIALPLNALFMMLIR